MHASATSSAATLTGRPSILGPRSPTWVYSSRNPVQPWTSSSRSTWTCCQAADLIGEHLATFGWRLLAQLWEEHDALLERLKAAR